MLNRILVSATLALATAAFAVTDVDVLLASQKRVAVPAPLPAALKAKVAAGNISSTEPRLGVPTFFWAPRTPNAPDLRLVGLTPENVARRALFDYAPLYRTTGPQLAEAKLAHVHDLGTGAVIVQFEHLVSGLKVFHERINVVMNQRLEVIALTGAFSPLPLKDGTFKLAATSALSVAFDGSFGSTVAPSQFLAAGIDDAGALRFQLVGHEQHSVSLARTMQVAFPDVDGRTLVPAYYVELEASLGTSTVSQLVGTVVSALDGRVLWRHSLTESDAYTYRVWADPMTLRPLDGPNGRATPHPTGNADFTVLPFVQPNLIILGNAGISTMDDWLGPAATQSTGNNVEAYADLVAPDGFGSGDQRGAPVGSAFIDTYDVALAPDTTTQRNAGITQLFYDVNWLHDAWYDKGFTETAGNAQTLNYGRGGAEGDSIKAEAQDYGGLNNANMSTPADGARPRMQMFLWVPAAFAQITLAPGPSPTQQVTAAFGPTSFNFSAQVALADDGTAPNSDACQPITNNVAGKIVLVDRGTCTFQSKALRVQQAGGVGMLVANNAPGLPPPMGTDATIMTPITIGSLGISQADGNALKAALLNGPVTATLQRTTTFNRDGSVDNTVVAHEWGHYISNRLIPGLGTQQARGMGEGWGDTMAMLMTVEESDAPGSANANFVGAYALAVWDMDSSAVATNAAYFGIRRAPYSIDFGKNAFTFGHISDGAPLPTHPLAAGGASNSEVHNVGEVWAIMLWECYASLLRDVPRLTFAQSQDRMMRYLVGGMKAMPGNPTFVESRDAILAVAAANDVQDFQLFAAAFARRGLGLLAVAPDRASTTLTGVVEDFMTGNDVAFVSAELLDDDAAEFCDRDGVLDVGEKGRLRITLRNTGVGDLSALNATVTSSLSGVTVTPAMVTFPTLAPFQSATVETAVRLPAGLTARTALDLTISYTDASLRVAGPRTANVSFIAQQDSVAASASSDDFEGAPVAWTFAHPMTSPAGIDFEVVAVDPMNHRLFGVDAPVLSDLRAESPTLSVGTGNFSVTFQNRYSFEYTTGPVTAWDGAVIELSTDDGMTWNDVGAAATPAYNATITNTAGSPLANRAAWSGDSAGYPMFIATTLNFGTTYAGQDVKLRFRVASDQNSAEVGWDLDDVVFTGLTNTPFPSVVAHRDQCLNRPPVANAGADQTVDERTMVTLSHAASTDLDGDMLTATWTQTAGPTVTLTNGVFTAPEVTADTVLRFSLVVNDGTVDSSNSDEVVVTVRNVNRAPVVNAGADLMVDERAAFTLSGMATDADGDPLAYTWRQVSGPATTLGSTSGATVMGVAPEVTMNTPVVFELRASDGTAAVTDTITLTVRQVNRPPSAQALADGFVDSGATVTLSGFVVDPDGDATTVLWTQTAGPTVELFTATAGSPSFTAPNVSLNTTLTFQLVASDGSLSSAPASVNVVVRGTNVGPIARPGMDVTVESGGTVTLDGSASSDPDGDALTFVWRQEGEGSRLALANDTTSVVTVTAPVVKAQERLDVVLYVRDPSGAVGNATVHVIVTPKTTGCGCTSSTGLEPVLLGLALLVFRRRAASR